MSLAEPTFVARAVLVDVGFTLTVYDGVRLARVAGAHGVAVDARAVQATEAPLRARMSAAAWSFTPRGDGAERGVALYRAILELAGARAEPDGLDRAARAIWDEHLACSLWDRPLPGAREALARLRAEGLRLVVVSNAEGNLEPMLERIGLRAYFDAVLDSSVVGAAKPDARIFRLALRAAGVDAAHAVMVGDSLPADVDGARALGIQAALLDPLGLFPAADAPRFHDFAAFARAVRRVP